MPEATHKMADYELMAWAHQETGLRATDVLREYTSALRADWGGVDGRFEKVALGRLADAIDHYGTATLKQVDLVDLRIVVGVTPSGSGERYDFSGKNHEGDHIYETFIAAKKVYVDHGGKGMAWW